MTVYALYNLKGGVGKTSAAVNLAYLSAQEGFPTLVWDLDPQGAASFYFRVKPRVKGKTRRLVLGKLNLDKRIRGSDFDLLDLLPADLGYRKMDIALDRAGKANRRIRRLIKPFRKEYANVFLDCPPSLTQVSESVFHAADVLLVPVIPTTLSMRTLEQVTSFVDREGIKDLRILPFFSMVDRRKRLHQDIVAASTPTSGWPFLSSSIPYSSDVEKMGLHRAPLVAYAPTSPAGKAFEALWHEVQAVVRDRSLG